MRFYLRDDLHNFITHPHFAQHLRYLELFLCFHFHHLFLVCVKAHAIIPVSVNILSMHRQSDQGRMSVSHRIAPLQKQQSFRRSFFCSKIFEIPNKLPGHPPVICTLTILSPSTVKSIRDEHTPFGRYVNCFIPTPPSSAAALIPKQRSMRSRSRSGSR